MVEKNMISETNYPLISVIVPVYNVESYLEKCVMSIIGQTYKNLEIILVDDGSSDSSGNMCDEFARRDSRIKVIHKANGGLVNARKSGIQLASGVYVAYVDADDWIDLDTYEIMYQRGGIYGADIVASEGYIKEYEGGSSIKVSNDLIPGLYQENEFEDKIFPFIINTDIFYQTDIPLTLCSFIFKRELLYQNQMLIDDIIRMGEDMICVWYCFLEAHTVALVDCCYYHYRQRHGSIIHTHTEDEYMRLQCLYKSLEFRFSKHRLSRNLIKKLDFFIYYEILLTNYKILLNKNTSFLFPFSKVEKGSNVVIYGAGVFGQEMINALKGNRDYNVVLWVDREYEDLRKKGLEIESPQSVSAIQYDYIILAITRVAVIKEIKKNLMDIGILEDKIAVIDIHVLTHDALPVDLI